MKFSIERAVLVKAVSQAQSVVERRTQRLEEGGVVFKLNFEVGKDADFVIWSKNPLSTFAVCEQTWIDGRNYFNLVRDQQLREKVSRERNKLIQKILTSESEPPGDEKGGGHYRPHLTHPYSCLQGVIQ